MSVRLKLFLLIMCVLLISGFINLYIQSSYILKREKEIALREGLLLAENLSKLLEDFVYYLDVDMIEELIDKVDLPFVEDIGVISSEGYLMASQREGKVIFKEVDIPEDLQNHKILYKEEEPHHYVIYATVSMGATTLGYLYVRISYKHAIESARMLISSTLRLYFLLSLLGFLLTLGVVRWFTGPLDQIMKALERVGRGDLDLEDLRGGEDEFGKVIEGVKKTAQKLKGTIVTRDYYLQVLDSLPVGVVIFDRSGNVKDMNTFARQEISEKSVNRLKEEVLGKEVKGLKLAVESPKGPLYLLLSSKVVSSDTVVTFQDITQLVEYENILREMAQRDFLTGIYNRRSFEDFLHFHMERARRLSKPLSLIVFDVDHFKKINDTYGHLVGDRVLKGIAQLVSESIRDSDIFARIGGEEFAIILPDTDEEGAKLVAEKLRSLVERSSFADGIRCTASFGVTTLREKDTSESFLERADKALYKAKRLGRNKVVSA